MRGMTTAPVEVSAPRVAADERPQSTDGSGLALRARAYYFAIVAATIGSCGPYVAHLGVHTRGLVAFAILATCASLAQLFVVNATTDHSFHTATIFLLAAALLLPPELVALVGIVQHVPEWIKHRYPWYIQSFNICNYTLNAMAAHATARFLLEH